MAVLWGEPIFSSCNYLVKKPIWVYGKRRNGLSMINACLFWQLEETAVDRAGLNICTRMTFFFLFLFFFFLAFKNCSSSVSLSSLVDMSEILFTRSLIKYFVLSGKKITRGNGNLKLLFLHKVSAHAFSRL